jgi:nucleotide-binding universal stress UspA family protein
LEHLHVETVVEYDAAVPMIHDLVQARHPDLVVIGSEGTSGIERVALGSVAESVARSVAVPVLIIGPHARGGDELFRSVVFATDLKSTGLRTAQFASSIAERFHSDLAVLHVLEREQPVSALRGEVQDRPLQQMKALLSVDAAANCVPEFMVSYGDAAEQILQVAHSRNATLVVLGSRRRALLEDHLPWTTLSQIVREAGCGVLVVRNRI